MTRYPNGACEAHRNVRTSEPVCLICMDAEMQRLRDENERLRSDARRYRSLRSAATGKTIRAVELSAFPCSLNGPELDAAIDAAQQEEDQ